jgi:hypothetical protein
MPESHQATEFRVVLHRVGEATDMFDAPGFSVLIQATDAEDAIGQVERLALQQNGRWPLARST